MFPNVYFIYNRKRLLIEMGILTTNVDISYQWRRLVLCLMLHHVAWIAQHWLTLQYTDRYKYAHFDEFPSYNIASQNHIHLFCICLASLLLYDSLKMADKKTLGLFRII